MARKAVARSSFTAAPGFHLSDKDAGVVGTELTRLQKRLKRAVLASDVVEDSKRPESPLHRFIWKIGDEEAAYRWRLGRATYLIQSIDVTLPGREAIGPIRAFIPVMPGSAHSEGFVPTATAPSEVIRRQVDRARADARSIYLSFEQWVSFAEFEPARDFVAAAKRLAEGT